MNISTIVVIIVLGFAVLSLFFGYTRSIGKSFDSNQPESSINASQSKQQQKQQAEDAEAQRRAYMEDVKQKMRDSQRR